MRRTAALLVFAVLAVAGCADDGGGDVGTSSPPVDDPALVDPVPVDPLPGGPGAGGRLVEATPGLEGVVESAISGYTVIDDTTLEVSFFTGVEECYGLEKITVAEADDSVTVTVLTGSRPGAEVCIEIAEQVRAQVTLAAPLGERTVVDGSTGEPVPAA